MWYVNYGASKVMPVVKNPSPNAGDTGTIPGSGRFPWPREKEMATHFSILAWKIPWTKEPGRLHSMGMAESQIQQSRYINYTLTYKKSSIRVTAYLRLSALSIWITRKQWDAQDKGQILTQPRSVSWRPLTEDSGSSPGPFQQTVLFSSWVIKIRKSAKIKHDGHHVTSLSYLKDQILFNCRLI